MAGEPSIEIVGSTTKEAELRFVPSGRAVCNVDIAVNPRRKDNQSGEWKEQPAQFYRLAVWGDMAENVAASFNRAGIRVTARGRISQVRTYELRAGGTGVTVEIDVDSIGPDLRFNAVSIPSKAERGGGGGGFGGNQDRGGFGGGGNQDAGGDPWATGGKGASAVSDEPPF